MTPEDMTVLRRRITDPKGEVPIDVANLVAMLIDHTAQLEQTVDLVRGVTDSALNHAPEFVLHKQPRKWSPKPELPLDLKRFETSEVLHRRAAEMSSEAIKAATTYPPNATIAEIAEARDRAKVMRREAGVLLRKARAAAKREGRS